jgi:hypothetical protein
MDQKGELRRRGSIRSEAERVDLKAETVDLRQRESIEDE